MVINLKINKRSFNGIKSKILLKFLLVLTIVFAIIWIFEVVLYDSIYEYIKTKELRETSNQIVNSFENHENEELTDLNRNKDCSIFIFTIGEDESIDFIYPTAPNMNFMFNLSAIDIVERIGTNSYVEYTQERDFKSLVIGQKVTIDEVDYYFYLSGTITPTNSTSDILTLLLAIITVVSFAITIVISIFFSKKISKPLEEMSKKAKELSSGNLNVKFTTNEFEEVEELSKTLNYSIEQIKKSQALEKDLIQNVSHELRTPLTMVECYAQMLKEFSASDKEKRDQHLDIILEESVKLEGLINDMIDLSKLQAKSAVYNDEKINLFELFSKLETYYKSKFCASGYTFTFQYPKKAFVFMDKVKIEQVITNLINNAINYSLDKKQIKVVLKNISEKEMKLSVIDKGMGIDKKEIDKVFDRHFRSTSAKKTVVGSGIGLTIVKEILNHYNVDFGVLSEVGKGSEFYIILKKVE